MNTVYTENQLKLIKILKDYKKKNGHFPYISQIISMDNDFKEREHVRLTATKLIRNGVVIASEGKGSKQLSLVE